MTLDGKGESPMNSTPTSKAIEPQDALIARADERLAHAYEQIARADEELTRVSEQVAKMEREAAPPRSAEPGPQSPPSAGPGPQSPPPAEPGPQAPPGRPVLRALVGLLLVAVVVLLPNGILGALAKLASRWSRA